MSVRRTAIETDNRLNQQGFTLLETMVAMLVFTIGILGMMTMTVNALNGYTRSRTSASEVGRTVTNLETLKNAGYRNSDIFTGSQTSPVGSDGAVVEYSDTVAAVVAETRLISLQNTAIKGSGPNNTYEVYFTLPLVE